MYVLPPLILQLFSFIIGLIFGSFISALSWRYPKDISITKGRSICPKCKKIINWYDNIPLLSFIILGGRCRNCRKRISFRYPLIELVTGLGFMLIGFNIIYLILFCILELIFIIDLENQLIPDDLVFIGLLLSLFITRDSLFSSVFSGFIAASALMLIHLLTKGRGMGLGDVKFAVLGGMLTGLNLCLIWLFLSFTSGGIVGIILLIIRKAGFKDKIAFGPFLIIGLILTYFYGNNLIELIMHQ